MGEYNPWATLLGFFSYTDSKNIPNLGWKTVISVSIDSSQ